MKEGKGRGKEGRREGGKEGRREEGRGKGEEGKERVEGRRDYVRIIDYFTAESDKFIKNIFIALR